MQKLIEKFEDYSINSHNNTKTDYIRYRIGRLKHDLWLRNRKRKTVEIEPYDNFIVKNLQPGKTCVFGSAGYYLEDIVPNLTVVEQWPIVKQFYPQAQIVSDRAEIHKINGAVFDNFVVINNRGDLLCDINGLDSHVENYVKAMHTGCLFFYSFRDTQIVDWNRLTVDHRDYFLSWGKSLADKFNLHMIWKDIQFAHKPKINNQYDIMENPDTTNGNIKFVFQYQYNQHIINESDCS